MRFFVGADIGPHTHVMLVRGIGGGIAWFAATMFVYLLNGVSDVDGDRVNGSSRPLAAGILETGAATGWCIVLALASLIWAVFIGRTFTILDVSMLVLGIAYSAGPRPAKNRAWSASVVVGVGGFLTYFAGMIAFSGKPDATGAIFAGVLAAWMAAAGNTKDFHDEAGDRRGGRRTLPVALGQRRAARVVAALAIVVACSGVGAAVLDPRLWPLAALVPFCVGMVWFMTSTRSAPKGPYRCFVASQWAVNLLIVASSPI